MKNYLLLLISFTLLINNLQGQMEDTSKPEEVTFQTTDGVLVTADLYMTADKNAPFIILCHQAGYSRGEYRPIAPILNNLGFNCMALDQRSGKEVNGVQNETNKAATKLGKETKYKNAIPDIEAAYSYTKNELQAKDIIIWGSSYSASLTFYFGSKYKDQIKGILAFSPGEYFTIDNRKIESFAAEVTCPVFVSSAKDEHGSWKGIYYALKGDRNFYLPTIDGFHGSRALWSTKEGHEDCWKEVKAFLMKFKE